MASLRSALILLGIAFGPLLQAQDDACPGEQGVAVQVLGSGGPIADDGRASSGYLVWVDGRARVLVDTGGGVFLRFGESGARFEDLELIALSHYHTDHSADLPALLKSGFFSPRERSLNISGPSGKPPFPGLAAYLDGLIGPEHGAYRYLSGYLSGTGGVVELLPVEVPLEPVVHAVLENRDLRVTAMPVSHGIVPAIAYRVETRGHRLVFAADQNAGDETFAEFARDADLLVMHLAIPGDAGKSARSLHATPEAVGQLAARARARRLVLSHFMARSLADLEANVQDVSKAYQGEVFAAGDLDCYRP